MYNFFIRLVIYNVIFLLDFKIFKMLFHCGKRTNAM